MNSIRLVILAATASAAMALPALTRHYHFQQGVPAAAGPTAVVGPSGLVIGNGSGGLTGQQSAGFGTKPVTKAGKPAKDRTLKGRVVSVESGDRLVVSPVGGTRQKVRMVRVKAPTVSEPYFQESRDFLSGLVSNKTVEVRWQQKDQFGYALGTVFLPNGKGRQTVEINLTTVTNGSTKYAPAGADDPKAFTQAEEFARNSKRGLWALGQ